MPPRPILQILQLMLIDGLAVTDEYRAGFKRAMYTFRHQRVYDPVKVRQPSCARPMTPPSHPHLVLRVRAFVAHIGLCVTACRPRRGKADLGSRWGHLHGAAASPQRSACFAARTLTLPPCLRHDVINHTGCRAVQRCMRELHEIPPSLRSAAAADNDTAAAQHDDPFAYLGKCVAGRVCGSAGGPRRERRAGTSPRNEWPPRACGVTHAVLLLMPAKGVSCRVRSSPSDTPRAACASSTGCLATRSRAASPRPGSTP